jgi:hypothetical protein
MERIEATMPRQQIMELIHTPINDPTREVRIATIHPAADINSPVNCSLSTHALATAPDYDALSYCWGDENHKISIFVEGRPYGVTTNLHSALRHLRHKSAEKRFWIDAICINQTDTTEKSHQIPLMGQIYRQAKLVIAWLGDADEETHLAFELMEAWGSLVTKRISSGQRVEDTKAEISKWLDRKAWVAVDNIFQRPYWTRLWALQECILAENLTIQCGGIHIDPRPIADFLCAESNLRKPTYRQHIAWLSDEQKNIIRPRQGMMIDPFIILPLIKNTRKENFSYSELISSTKKMRCKDPRDRLFAILGLADLNSLARQIPVEPDYSDTVERVFTKFAISAIRTTQTLELLSIAGTNNQVLRGNMPSWAPDLTSWSFSQISGVSNGFNPLPLSFKPEVLILEDVAELRTRGILCDTVVSSYETATDLRSILQGWASCTNTEQHPTELPWRQVLYRTLKLDEDFAYKPSNLRRQDILDILAIGFVVCMGLSTINRDMSTLPTGFDKESYVNWFYLWAYGREAFFTATDEQKKEAFIKEFCRTPETESRLRAVHTQMSVSLGDLAEAFEEDIDPEPGMFDTEKGYFGTCRKRLQPGDKVCILPSCKTPLIVRSVGCYYSLVDYAYVYGMMKGEVMEEVQAGTLDFQDIVFK